MIRNLLQITDSLQTDNIIQPEFSFKSENMIKTCLQITDSLQTDSLLYNLSLVLKVKT